MRAQPAHLDQRLGCDVDHPHLIGGQVVDRPAQVEVAIHDRAQPVAVAGAEGGEVSLFDWDEIGNRIAALSRGG